MIACIVASGKTMLPIVNSFRTTYVISRSISSFALVEIDLPKYDAPLVTENGMNRRNFLRTMIYGSASIPLSAACYGMFEAGGLPLNERRL